MHMLYKGERKRGMEEGRREGRRKGKKGNKGGREREGGCGVV